MAKTIAEGVVTNGLLISTRAPYSRVRARLSAYGKVLYLDPTTGESKTIRYGFSANSGMPPALYSAVSRTTNVGLIRQRYSALLAYRRQLESQQLSKDVVDELVRKAAVDVTERALASQPGGSNRVEGGDGYMQLPDPLPVKVHLRASANKYCRVVVTFPNATV